MDIARECIKLVEAQGVNSQSSIDFEINGEMMHLTLAYIIDTYMQASQESQLVFLRTLQKSSNSAQEIQFFFEGMGKLLLMSQLSEKFTIEG
jgi:hypothetical protein